MALRGDLASVDLAQVFQMLALNQKVGLLYIQSPASWKALYFNDNGVTLYFNEHTMLDRVLAKLIRGGQISATGVLEAREHAAHQGHQVVDGLLAGGYLTEDELDRSVRAEIEEEIYELFFWHDAKFEFYEGATELEGREGVVHEQFFFGTDAVIMEAARRIDEWQHIKCLIPSTDDVFRRNAQSTKAYDLDDELFQVFELVDGMRSVERVVEISGESSFAVHKSLVALIEEEILEPLPPEDFIAIGQECQAEGRTETAINLFERAVEFGVGLPGVHHLAAAAYRDAGEFEKASIHIKALAEHHAANGNLKKATTLFQEVLEMLPTDLAACQRVVELSIDHSELATDDFDPLNVGKDLVDLYLEIGEIDRVRALLEELIREHPADIELKKSLINVHTKVGDTKRVIELYESIAEDLTNNGDPIEAIKYLQKILQLNRARTDISEWIKRLYQVEERQRSRRRSMIMLGVAFGLLVLASVGYFFYNSVAADALEALNIETKIAEKKYPQARADLHEFIEAYPFTMVISEAETLLDRIKKQEDANSREDKDKLLRREKELSRLRYAYKAEWKLYETHFGHSELEKALRSVEKVKELVAQAGEGPDKQWATAKKVEKNHKDLLTYLTNASLLHRNARKAEDAQDWPKHRRLVLELVKDYELADVAKRAEISVKFDSRPQGAMVLLDGRPLTREVNGEEQPLRTPVVVLCPNKRKVEYTLQRAGFQELAVSLNPRSAGSVRAVLTIVPNRAISFGTDAISAPGVSRDGKVVVGLKEGKIGFFASDKSRPVVRKLNGLSDLNGTPAVSSTHAYFRTNQGEFVSHRLSDGKRVWSYKVKSPVVHDPVIANNRLFLVDRDGTIQCRAASDRGRLLWKRAMRGAATGMPTVVGRTIGVGSQLGTVLVLDSLEAAAGKTDTRIELRVGVSTRVHVTKSTVVFGTEDGKLHAFRRGTKKPQSLWTLDIGRAIRAGEMALHDDHESVFVVAVDKTLQRIRLADGKLLKQRKMSHRPRPGLSMFEGNLVTVLQVIERQRDQSTKTWDVMLALDPASLEAEWRFTDGGSFAGRPARGSKRLYLTGSNGEVLRFQ